MAKQNATSASYAAIVAEAEAAVASVKDPELRAVAFDKILSTLLEAGASKSAEKRGRTARSHDGRSSEAKIERKPKKHRGGPKTYVESLIDDGYFKKQRTIAEVKAELANRGHHIALTSLSGPLQALTQKQLLRRQKIAAGGKGKTTYAYSNW